MEIERKWLVLPEHIPYDLASLESHTLEQAYVSFSPTVRIRSIDGGAHYILTIKKRTENGDIASEENELELDKRTYEFLFSQHEGSVICKQRFLHPLSSGLLEEIDLFSGALEGLAYLEIEFPTLEEARAYPTPSWVLADVTEDHRYKNASLARFGRPESLEKEEEK